ncbi:MAG: hypothetical protein OHK0012_26970 [Synechococcales cyanobacterium]
MVDMMMHTLGFWLATAEAEALVEEAEGFDWLESNFFNVLLLVALLVYLARTVVAKILSERRQTILTEIQGAEQRRDQARQQLAEQQKNLAAAEAQAADILKQAEVSAAQVRAEVLATIDEDIARLRASADQDLASQSDRVMQELRQRLVEQVLQQVESDLPAMMTEERQSRLIEQSLAALAGRN